MTITHGGGESLDTETIRVTVDGTEGFPSPENPIDTREWWNKTIPSGDSFELYNATDSAKIAERGDTVRIIRENSSGGFSNELSDHE